MNLHQNYNNSNNNDTFRDDYDDNYHSIKRNTSSDRYDYDNHNYQNDGDKLYNRELAPLASKHVCTVSVREILLSFIIYSFLFLHLSVTKFELCISQIGNSRIKQKLKLVF